MVDKLKVLCRDHPSVSHDERVGELYRGSLAYFSLILRYKIKTNKNIYSSLFVIQWWQQNRSRRDSEALQRLKLNR